MAKIISLTQIKKKYKALAKDNEDIADFKTFKKAYKKLIKKDYDETDPKFIGILNRKINRKMRKLGKKSDK